MTALILLSHGSVLDGAGETLFGHARMLRERAVFPLVEVAFLNYNEPTLADAVAKCAAAGSRRVVISPYFLVPGKFVTVDLPRQVQAARERWPELELLQAEAIGYDERLADALIELAQESHVPSSVLRPPFSPPPDGQKRAMLVMVHGSPRAVANEDMFRVVDVVRLRGLYPILEVGFLECNEPDISSAIATCAKQGADRIDAVPYFLHTGTHVIEDLPDLLEEGRKRYPNVEFRMTPFLGTSPRVAELAAQRAREALERRKTED